MTGAALRVKDVFAFALFLLAPGVALDRDALMLDGDLYIFFVNARQFSLDLERLVSL